MEQTKMQIAKILNGEPNTEILEIGGERTMIENNTVIISLKNYLDLIKKNESLKEEVELLHKDNHDLSTERAKLKKEILKEAEYTTIWRYHEFGLSRIINIQDSAFGLRDHERLLRLGFTLEELIDYIIERRQSYESEGGK